MTWWTKKPTEIRTLAPLYYGDAFGPAYLKTGYSIATDGAIYPGMVLQLVDDFTFDLADGDVTGADAIGGHFYGLCDHFVTASVDESNAGINPVAIWKDRGTYQIMGDALDSGSTYAVSSSGYTELIVGNTSDGNKGKLIPRGDVTADDQPTVALLLSVDGHVITVELLPPA